jgi:hypothetical protein
MSKTLRILTLTAFLLALSAMAYAYCTTTTYVVNGKVMVCQTCCENGNCQVYCN